MTQAVRTSRRNRPAIAAPPPTVDSGDLEKLVARFHESHPDSFHDERVVAAVIGCSEEKLQRDRWAGKGLPFVRFGRLIRYRKRNVIGVPTVNPSQREAEAA